MEGKGRWKGKKKKKNLTDLEQRQQQREALANEANRRSVGGGRSLDGGDNFGIIANGPNRRWWLRDPREWFEPPGIVVKGPNWNRRQSSWMRIGVANGNQNRWGSSPMGIRIGEIISNGNRIVEIVTNGNRWNRRDHCEWVRRMGSSRMALRMGSALGGFWFMTTVVKERMDKMKKSREVYSRVFSDENFPSPMPHFSSQNV